MTYDQYLALLPKVTDLRNIGDAGNMHRELLTYPASVNRGALLEQLFNVWGTHLLPKVPAGQGIT